MTREGFMSRLRAGLSGLPDAAIADIAADYDTHFTEGAAAGRNEADVAAALGDPDRLARELKKLGVPVVWFVSPQLWAWKRRRLRWVLWTVLLLTLGVLFWLHPRLDALMDLEASQVLDRERYLRLHFWYLNISTVQWATSLMLLATTLLAWRGADRGTSSNS